MNFSNHIRASQDQQIIVAFQVARMRHETIGHSFATIFALRQFVLLDHRASPAVKHENTFRHQGKEFFGTVGLHRATSKTTKTALANPLSGLRAPLFDC